MAVTPDFVGQIYKDTSTGNLWRSNSTTPGDWTLEVRNMLVKSTPDSVNLAGQLGFFTYGNIPGTTSLQFNHVTLLAGFDIEAGDDLTSVTFPNLASIDIGATQGGYLYIGNLPLITSLSIPNLSSVAGYMGCQNCMSITSVSLPSLVTVGGNFLFGANTSLTTVSIPNFLPTDGKTITFVGCALTEASVDHILSRCVANPAFVSGTVNVSGGTNSPPSTPIGDGYVATLLGRGVNVVT